MKREIDQITTAQARSVCILLLRIDVSKLSEVQIKTMARSHLRTVKKEPLVALAEVVKPYKRVYK